MAITPNYSWPLPDDTDLVKDGAEAIRDLGNAIDTTVDGLGVGLVLIDTQTFSAVSSIENDFWSADYDLYKVFIVITTVSGTPSMYFRFRTSGGNISAANYNYAYNYYNTLGGARQAASSATGIRVSGPLAANSQLDLTVSNQTMGELVNTTVNAEGNVGGGFYSSAITETGINLYVDTGSITGSYQIYGLKK